MLSFWCAMGWIWGDWGTFEVLTCQMITELANNTTSQLLL